MALIIDAPMPPSCKWHNTNGRNTSEEICPYLQSCSAEFNIDAYRPSDCPIIGEIPDKHGDLVSRDSIATALRDYLLAHFGERLDEDLSNAIYAIIAEAETIVEASE